MKKAICSSSAIRSYRYGKKTNVKQSVQLTIVDRQLYYKVTVLEKERREYCPIYDINGYKEEKAKELRE